MASAVISLSGSSTTEIVAAKTGMRIRVFNYTLVSDAGGTYIWKSGTTALTGSMVYGANGGASPSAPKSYLIQTAVGDALNITHTATAGGHLEYDYSP